MYSRPDYRRLNASTSRTSAGLRASAGSARGGYFVPARRARLDDAKEVGRKHEHLTRLLGG
jgi:hypothetical protein